MNSLYKVTGISKQAVYKYALLEKEKEQKLIMLISEAEDLRREHPGCGVEKMYYTLQPDFLGRDKFIETFMMLGFRVKRKKNYRRTTYSSKVYYPNLIKGMEVTASNVIWQSDITYIEAGNRFYYAVFIIDVYTKELVGYQVSEHMFATANIKAFKMASDKFGYPKIHHSDRGSQYIYKEYISLLETNGTFISMALTAQENAYAERINRTIKEEYLSKWEIKTFPELKRAISRAVKNYNTKRIHNHLGRRTPQQFREFVVHLPEQDRPVVTIFNNRTENSERL
jgi:hypothetical protein